MGRRIGRERNEERREPGSGRAERRGRVRITEKEMESGEALKRRAKGWPGAWGVSLSHPTEGRVPMGWSPVGLGSHFA